MPDEKPEEGQAPKSPEDHTAPENGSAKPALPSRSPADILQKMPAEQREVIESFFGSLTFGPPPNPIAEKVTSEHVGQLIKNQERETELSYADRKDARRYALFGTGVGGVILLALVLGLALSGHESLAIEIVKAGLYIGGGVGGGYGLAVWQRRGQE